MKKLNAHKVTPWPPNLEGCPPAYVVYPKYLSPVYHVRDLSLKLNTSRIYTITGLKSFKAGGGGRHSVKAASILSSD